MAKHNRPAADDPRRYDIATNAGPHAGGPMYLMAPNVSASYARVVEHVLKDAGWAVELHPQRVSPQRPA